MTSQACINTMAMFVHGHPFLDKYVHLTKHFAVCNADVVVQEDDLKWIDDNIPSTVADA